MPIIPIPDGLRRVARDSFDESEAERYRAEADAKLKALQNTPMAQLSPDEPLKGDFKRPTWMGSRGYDTPDFTSSAEPTIVPAEGDQSRDLNELGLSPRFSEELSQPAAPESDVPGVGFGSGGPEGGALSEATILDIRKRLADKQASTSADKDMRSRLLQGVNPDEAASAIDLAAKSGVNRLQVEVNPETYKRADTMRQIDQLRTTAPKLRAWLDYNPENLDVSHDDVDNLSWWEQIGSFLSPGSLTAEEVGGALRTGAVEGGAQQFYGAAEMGIGINRMFEFIPGMKALNDAGEIAARTERQKAAITAAANMPKGDTWLERGIYGAAQSAPASIEAMIVSVLTKNPLPGVATMGVATGGQAYGEAEDAGKPFLERMRYAVTQGGIEAATEFLPMKFIVGDLAKDTPLGKMFLKNALAEGIGEQAATFLQDASTWLELNPEKTLGEFMGERPNAALETLVASTLMSGVQTTIAKGAQVGVDQFDQNAQQKRAEDLAKTFEAMAEGAGSSKLLKRLPEKYRDVVAAVTKDGPLESVRVQPEAFNELAQSAGVTAEQLAQAFRIDPADIVSAIESGEDVVIPAGNYAAALSTAKKEIGITGEQIHTAFAPNMRLRADDFTAKEREAMKAVFEEEQAARAESGTKEQGFADSADRVREMIREQVASLKIFNTEAANTQAAIVGEMVTTLAERTGQDPETLWKEQGFDIIASLTAQETGVNELPQSFMREAAPVSDAEIVKASEDLQPREFDAWKMAREGKSNEEIAVLMDSEGVVTPSAVAAYLTSARAKGFDAPLAKEPSNPKGRPKTNETQRVIEMLAAGTSREEIAKQVYPSRDRQKAMNLIRQLNHKHKDVIAERSGAMSLAQSSLPMDEASRMGRRKAWQAEKGPVDDKTWFHSDSQGFEAVDPTKGELGLHVGDKFAADLISHRTKRARRWSSKDGNVAEPNMHEMFVRGNFASAPDLHNFASPLRYLEARMSPSKAAEFDSRYDKMWKQLDEQAREIYSRNGDDPAAWKSWRDAVHTSARDNKISGWEYANQYEAGVSRVIFDPTAARRTDATFDPAQSGSSKLLAQGERGTFTPRADRSIVRLFESSNLSTLVHEGAHWYLDTLWRMSQTENPHPFVLEQVAAILEWQGKSPNWTAMFSEGRFTEEGRDLQEAFAESFEAYLREGKAPTSALRSVFASFKAWLMRIYKSVSQIGGRVRLNDEIRQVFDRMLATEDAIKAATTSQARDSAAMAQALLAKGIITEKAVERTTARLAAARERAEAELMARLMEDYERSQKSWYRDEERQVRRDVTSEIDERPEQRAFAWLTGKGWRDTREDHTEAADEEAEGMALLQRQLDLPTPEQRAAWVRDNTVSDVIPGEAANSRQYGFKLSNGLGIVASLIPQVNGETEIHWTFLSRLMDRASEEDVYAKGDESLTGKEVLEMMPRILAIVETDMAQENRDAYTFTSARRSIRNMNARLVRLLEGFDYEIVEFPGQDDPILLHKDADIAGNGKIIPRPENAGRKFEWDRTEDPEAYADAFYAKVSDLRPGRPAGRSDGGERDRGDAARGELADAVRYVDLNATTESLRAMQARMVADNVVPAILLFRTDDGRVIAVSGEDVNFSHDQARDTLGLGNIHLAHGVYNPRRWPTLEAMEEAGLHAWYGTSGREDGAGMSLAQSVRPDQTLAVVHNLTEQNLFHAEEIGGLAAPSLAVVDTNKGVLNNFGGITLVAEPDFLSTSKVRTFDADIYSPRHPRPLYDIDDKAASALLKELREITKGLGDLREIDFDALHKDGPSSLVRNDMVKAAFFASRGELPKRLPRKEIPQADDATKAAAKLDVMAKDTWETREDSRVKKLAEEHFKSVVEATRSHDPELADDLAERFFSWEQDDGQKLLHPNYLQRFILDARAYRKAAAREVDTIELGSMLSKKLRDKKTEAAFEGYVETLAARVITGKSLFKGFTNSGNRRYGDYTMETILREMTQELQGGENWHYGAGSVRARYANELKSLSAIRARKDQLVSEEEMKAAKDEGQDALMELLEYLKPYYRFGGGNQFMQMDDMSKALMEGSKGIREAFDFKGDPEPQVRIREFIDLLTGLPTEYFEAKAQRAVDLSEFTAAVVPRGTSERALEILRKAGLEIRFYKRDDAADRTRAVRGVRGALFQTGADTKGRTAPPPNLPPMRLDLQAVKDQYGEEALANLPPEVAAYSASATDADQFLEVARDVRNTLKKKKPKSLVQFLSSRRVIGKGNDKVAYKGIRDQDNELTAAFIGETPPEGLIAPDRDTEKKTRAATIGEAVLAAYEEGYFDGSPPNVANFIAMLKGDISGAAPVYAKTDRALVKELADAEVWSQWFEDSGVDITASEPELRAKLETLLTSEVEGAISPDGAAELMNGALSAAAFPDGSALLQGLKEGPKRNELIRKETQRRMIERHGDPFKDGTIMREAETFARNEVQQRQLEIELEALAKATGQFAASNLAKQQAQENLRTKQVREVLNYNQWLILEQRWGKKALEAATKGKFDEAARYKKFQLLNLHMFREGRKLAEKIETTRKTLVAYGTKPRQQRLFAAGKEYAENMNSLLDDYQLRNETKAGEDKRVQRAAWIKAQLATIDPFASYQDTTKSAQEQQVEAAEAIERSRALANEQPSEAKGYKSLTVEEFMAVDAEASMIWKMATLADQRLKEGKRRRLTLAAEDVAAEIIANQPKEKPPEPIESDAPGEKVKRGVLKYFAMHRTMQSLANQFAGGKDGGEFWSYFVKPLNAAFAHLSTLRKQMGEDLTKLFGAYSSQEIARFYKDRQTFNLSSGSVALTTQGRLAVALNVGNEKNRQRLMDSMGWTLADIQTITDTLTKRDWDFVQATWDYLNTWFPEANRVHEAVHGAPMDKVEPLQVATRFGVYAGGYYPIAFDPELSSKSAQRKTEADAKSISGRVDARSAPSFSKKRVEGKVTLPLKLSVFDVITRHLDQVATSIATEEVLFDAGRLIRRTEVEEAIVKHHGRQIYNTIVNTLVTTKFGMEGTSGILAHLRNGATVVGLGWKVSTALLQPLGVSNSVVRVGGYWVAKGYARMGRDAATIQSSAKWVMDRSEFMRNRRQSQSPELAALRDSIKKGGLTPRWLTQSMFALMSNTQFYSVDLPTWYAGWYKAKAAGLDDVEAAAQGDQAVIDAQGGGELHQTAAIQTGAGTKYAAALRLLTNFMSYMVTTYNLATQRARNADTVAKMAALAFDMVILLAIPVAGKMALDAWTKGGGDDDDELWEKYGREQAAFLMSPFVGISQVAGSMRGDDAFSYRGPAGLGIFAEATNAGKAAAELDFDQSFWRPANKVAGMMLHYPASQADLTFRGALALWNGETTNPAAIFFGPAPAN